MCSGYAGHLKTIGVMSRAGLETQTLVIPKSVALPMVPSRSKQMEGDHLWPPISTTAGER